MLPSEIPPGLDEGCQGADRQLENSKASLSGICHLLLSKIVGASVTENLLLMGVQCSLFNHGTSKRPKSISPREDCRCIIDCEFTIKIVFQ